jgi:uncharacterized Zn finger protein
MSWVPLMEKSADCKVCGNMKARVLRRYSDSDSGAWSERTVMYYETPDGDEATVRVYCSNCGIIYHEDSIYG